MAENDYIYTYIYIYIYILEREMFGYKRRKAGNKATIVCSTSKYMYTNIWL